MPPALKGRKRSSKPAAGLQKRQKRQVDDDSDEDVESVDNATLCNVKEILRQHEVSDGQVLYRKTLKELKKHILSELKVGYTKVFVHRFLDAFNSKQLQSLQNPKLAALLNNVECVEYTMEHMDAQLSTSKHLKFGFPSENGSNSLSFHLTLRYDGFTDGMGSHECIVYLDIPGKGKNGRSKRVECALYDYEDYEDLFDSKMRKGDHSGFYVFWEDALPLRNALMREPFNNFEASAAEKKNKEQGNVEEATEVEEDEEEDDADEESEDSIAAVAPVTSRSPKSTARKQFMDFLNKVVLAMKHTHPYDSDDD